MSINQKHKLGIILFVIGSIVAIASGAKVAEQGAQYPSTLPVFLGALLVAVLGNFLWHGTERSKVLAELEEHKNDDQANPMKLLEKTLPAIKELQGKFNELNEQQIMQQIDDISADLINPFVEKRKVLMDVLGQQKGAEILLEVAYGERMLNRTWSAISDHHPAEAKHSLSESIKSYQQAIAKL